LAIRLGASPGAHSPPAGDAEPLPAGESAANTATTPKIKKLANKKGHNRCIITTSQKNSFPEIMPEGMLM
jgi:hypothetical protein